MKIGLTRAALALTLLASSVGVTAADAEATHNLCQPHFQGDDVASWPLNPQGAICRNVIVDSGHGQLLSRAGLLAREALFTSSAARFTKNFLWYSRETQVTVADTNTKWSACRVEPGYNRACDIDDIVADNFSIPHGPGRGAVLRAFDYPSEITLSVFEYGGMWIARACGNWKDVPDRPNPIPYFDGIKFRDDDRDGTRDVGEQTLAGWEIRITRESSLVGEATGVVDTVTTDANGYYRYDLDGAGPGRYLIEEIPQAGWKNYTPISYSVDVAFGVGDRQYTRNFGNAETVADVAKSSMSIIAAPATFDVNTPTDVTVSVTLENLGPADQVPVRDELEILAGMPPDCTTQDPRRTFTALLRRNEPVTRQFVFSITCTRPSEHHFEFDDVLSITDTDITDINPLNNEASASFVSEVHADTDLSIDAALTCASRTDVAVVADCDVDITVTNDGFGPIDATVAAQLALPADCTAEPDLATIAYPDLADGATVTKAQHFDVVCTHRSFHNIDVSVAVTADDPHVFDLDPYNNTAGDGPSIMEVFHDAAMAPTRVHLVCDEAIDGGPFTCTATVDYEKTGPAPLVDVDLSARLEGPVECAITAPSQVQNFVLGETPGTRSFTWNVACEPSNVLHPFMVTTDISPSEDEPHAVDTPSPLVEWWVVPYCLPTVNPHGQREPQAPGSGMNEDGFYIFGTLPNEFGEAVFVRDDESGVVFGPFQNGTRIKWVEANGASPTMTSMGGNNGNGKGQALAVDYQIRAQGDAQAFFVDEEGVEVSVTCLVPPFPK